MAKKAPIILEYMPVDVEIIQERVIDEAKGDRELDVKVKWQHAGIINNNRRRYREELLQREIGIISKTIKENKQTVWGGEFHPEDGIGKARNISHMWTKVWMSPSGVCEGNLTILSNPAGRNIQTLVKAGRLGLSSRGFGTFTEKEEKIDGKLEKFLDINDDYKMTTPGDWVVAPSVQGAGNLTEEIHQLESKLNEGLDPIKTDKKIHIGEEKMTLEELREKYPELVKQIEDAKEAALKVESDKAVEQSNTKITDLEKEVETLKEEKVASEAQVKGLTEKVGKFVNFLREFISSAGEQPDVLPEGSQDDPNAGSEGDEKLEAELAKTKEDLEKANSKVETFETKEKDRVEAEQKEKDAKELQTSMKAKLDELLATDEYKANAAHIEKEVTDEDGNITAESVEAVESVVKTASEKISTLKTEIEKGKITQNIDPQGHIENPEGGDEEATKEKIRALYHEAQLAGEKGTLEEWKKAHPALIESV